MSKKVCILVIILIVVATGIIEWRMGRILFCKCGVVSLWSGDIWSNQNSQQFADPYTFTHIMHGFIFYWLTWLVAGKRLSIWQRLVIAVALEGGWEIAENTEFVIDRYREATISLDYYGDSILNSLSDILAVMVGFGLAWKLPVRISVLGMIGLELALLWFMRDGLILNVIMLMRPIEAIKNWQMIH